MSPPEGGSAVSRAAGDAVGWAVVAGWWANLMSTLCQELVSLRMGDGIKEGRKEAGHPRQDHKLGKAVMKTNQVKASLCAHTHSCC